MPFDFPQDIRRAITRACQDARTPRYGANFIHTDTGEPTASLGRLSGGVNELGVYDDLIVGLDKHGRWGVFSDRGERLGSYSDARSLREGLRTAIEALYPKRAWRRSFVTPAKSKNASGRRLAA